MPICRLLDVLDNYGKIFIIAKGKLSGVICVVDKQQNRINGVPPQRLEGKFISPSELLSIVYLAALNSRDEKNRLGSKQNIIRQS